ncbi:MBL fold metallo-hydrolase [Dactylosporangium sp. NBC_01737]|uniref:MBL fold metallo-hydrolase n=1 Tax=Dactylosporangium sp. NBC_01737 TaxID=2975959 RepID=UPI002E0D4B64|nr:MBL fold metallo-hydrolase [Dactylosporangium sp. NBC_01737]
MDLVELLPRRLYLLAFPVGHAYLWCAPDGLTLIDTGMPGSAPRIAEAVTALGHTRHDLRQILLTHAHVDHIGAAADLAAWGDVVVAAHHDDAPVVRGEAANPPPVLAEWEQHLYDQIHADLPADPPPPARVDRELHDGDIITLGGGVEAVAVAVPGHTPGSVAFHLPDQRVLFTGDTIARAPDGTVMLGVFNTDPARAADSLRRQAALRPDIACFGHGTPLTDHTATTLATAASRH